MAGLICFSVFQQHRCPDLSDFQQKMASILSYNEKLLKEKEVLSEELNSCTDKVVRTIGVLGIVECARTAVSSSLWAVAAGLPVLVHSYRCSSVTLDLVESRSWCCLT